ncbi:MAG: hypothetical protein IPJ30_14665 [Acidobacteria bacterium]|nr:hypothetical protein [Acidobacteriota bacterium]
MIKKAILFVLISVFAAQAQQQNDWPTATPKSVGLDEKALAAFDSEITLLLKVPEGAEKMES